MPTEIGDAEKKYRDKIKDTDDLDMGWEDLYDMARNKPVRKRINFKWNPYISYGVDKEEEYDNDSNEILFGINKREIIAEMEKWQLKFLKPGKKKGYKMEFLLSEYGAQENQEETLANMLQRQAANNEKFHIDIREDDVRYDISIDKPLPDRSAYFIILRDVSGSMVDISDFAYKVALRITIWLQHLYKENVTRVYAVHSVDAMEVSEEEMFGINGRETPLDAGNTAFIGGYELVESMLKGTQYKSTLGLSRHIDSENEDVYLLHITDGENGDANPPIMKKIRSFLPSLTRFMYLEIGSGGNASSSFSNSLYQLKAPNMKVVVASNDENNENVKKTIADLLGN